MFRQTVLLHGVERTSLYRVPKEASKVSYSLYARQPSFRLLALNIAYNYYTGFHSQKQSVDAEVKEKVSNSRTFSQRCRASLVSRRCPAFEEIIRAVCCADDRAHGQQKERETYQH